MNTAERIKVMQAYLDGKEVQYKLDESMDWINVEKGETPSWTAYKYRVKPEPKQYYQILYKDTINSKYIYAGRIDTDKEALKKDYRTSHIIGFILLPPIIEA